ncbi:GntR family transcriptional regulator [Lichenihabitans sp. Uapishka_5]|uniref:GntR family transcriptional regulator n=1 Tax=Lichenihabitans sp. Uapishka_5 TaxID=3037302 RepID=UPI0029E7FB68|nr:GntR family transcriptional regulator [Lichenihabitans sp. Uapishka_5]MDX7950853.1 GntR family transcriptional regulator [Lichenihabitans sp. Uapishka_5]
MRPEPLRDPASSHPPTTRAIYAALRREIVTLALLPGAKLSENELALRFGTSRGPVREALIRLGEDGLIDVLPQRGSFVGRLSLPAIERARFVREALEIAVVRRAATEGLSDGQRRHIEAALAAQAEAGLDAEHFIDFDDAFHAGFAEAIGLGSVWGIVEREKVQFDRIRFLSLPAATPIALLLEQHRAILAAVLDRDPAAAEAAMRAHMAEVLKIVSDLPARHPALF